MECVRQVRSRQHEERWWNASSNRVDASSTAAVQTSGGEQKGEKHPGILKLVCHTQVRLLHVYWFPCAFFPADIAFSSVSFPTCFEKFMQDSSELLSDMVVRYSQQVRSYGLHAWNHSLCNSAQSTATSTPHTLGVAYAEGFPEAQESPYTSAAGKSSVSEAIAATLVSSEGSAGASFHWLSSSQQTTFF
jgi:hypothetical protein